MAATRTCRICGRNELSQRADCPDCGNELPAVEHEPGPPPVKRTCRAIPHATSIYDVSGRYRGEERTKPAWNVVVPAVIIIVCLTAAVFVKSGALCNLSFSSPSSSAAGNLTQLQQAAERGDAEAQFSLAERYSKGRGVPKDTAEMLRWYRQAADQGHSSAQFALGELFSNGNGVDRNLKEAAKWYRMAAGAGNTQATAALKRISR